MQHSTGFLAIVNDAKSRIKETDLDGYKAMQAAGVEHILVDVREESEWAAGHATGAIHLSKGLIERDIEHTIPDKGAKIVLYCGGGFRSALAADNIAKMGYADVVSLDGGWKGWVAGGMPTE